MWPVNSGDDVSSRESRDSEQGTMPGPEFERKVELLLKLCSACLVPGSSHGGGRGGEISLIKFKKAVFWHIMSFQVNAARDGVIDFVAGAIGATVSVYVGQPLDTVKVCKILLEDLHMY